MIFIYGEMRQNSIRAQSLYAERYRNRTHPLHRTFQRLCKKLKETGNLGTRKSSRRKRATDERNEVGVLAVVTHNRVIALNKRHRYNKFAPKGKEFVLVGYCEESKAYRLWERGSRTVEKYRDVRFLEDQDAESPDNEETFFEMPLNQPHTDESDDE
ncbi:hypothetical protein WN55_06247 [Dufourea novaeangliae]|uniref:Uncharacterized protein n=1 Tax=Dufourea novaeangliae TaxID=178035 RepID=A0A154PRK7_DUFNO|nr:hypothetical protein WN55_06247 [Dufourea novaeangliae]